jgi:folate-dependent phosphoribosylglycinamide formyltransferase PurN
MSEKCVVLLAGSGPSTRAVYHALRQNLGSVRIEVILERPVGRMRILRRRARRLGVRRALGQMLFASTVVPALAVLSRERVAAVTRDHRLNENPIPEPVHRVTSANSYEARELLRTLAPDVVVVNGTRILQRETLAAVPVPFLNMHAGITPAYRGVHGGYWALVEGRPELVGTTVHRLDEGIDTGPVIAQAFFGVSPADCFCTYPYLHTAAGLPLLLAAVKAALDGDLKSRGTEPGAPSVLRYHPTLWEYLRNRFSAGVR